MTAPLPAAEREFDYSKTLFLPETDFPMRAGLPQREPEILDRWQRIRLRQRLRESAAGRPRVVLHDGPPYANGNIHIGHALNKILKDLVTRSHQMAGADSDYVPGWDCHGLPIEWKIEEQYRAKGKNKDEVPVVEFRQECRAFAQHWLEVQREEFRRLGVEGDWAHPYTTMAFPAEAQIAREIQTFAMSGQLYRGSKPVMWSVVEKTALAEAEVEYHDHTSDMVWVAFPVVTRPWSTIHTVRDDDAGTLAERERKFDETILTQGASVVIWTTTPWTIPGNRAIAFTSRAAYGLYRVIAAAEQNWAKVGANYILADKLAADVFKAAKVDGFERVADVSPAHLSVLTLCPPLRGLDGGYTFDVPLLDGDHVTDDTGTGFVHTAPSHGREDYDIWLKNTRALRERGIDTTIPYTVDGDGYYTDQAPGFGPRDTDGHPAQVITAEGKAGDANRRVTAALIERGRLVARDRLRHSYPHSWRSKKPVIFRNTPQWFIAMDEPYEAAARGGPGHNGGDTLRNRALAAIQDTQWVPAAGENRITGMIANRPDWVVSRQRAWGVPIAVFVRELGEGAVEILKDQAVNARVIAAFEAEGADAWYKPGAAERFLGARAAEGWAKVDDILDVWFDSGSTHAFTLEDPEHFPQFAGLKRTVDGGRDRVVYLEGSDQHRGWFHSSLLESCGTRGRAPFDTVVTHGFVLDEKGQKMSKSVGNTTAPQDVIDRSGADILRLWVASSDYADDLRIGKEILKTVEDTYRKLRNTLRWMLGTLAHFEPGDTVAPERPELERLMLHRLAELDGIVRKAYAEYDYKRVVAALSGFMTGDLSAFYFDIRKDALYCDPASSERRRAALDTVNRIFRCVTVWLAPILAFTADEAWVSAHGGDTSVHLETFPEVPAGWRDDALAARWDEIKAVRRVVTGALELERAQKRIGSSLEAAPVLHIADVDLVTRLHGVDMAEVCIVSDIVVVPDEGPADAFRLDGVPGVSVEPTRAGGVRCARSWKRFDPRTADPEFPDITPRDAAAMREWQARAA